MELKGKWEEDKAKVGNPQDVSNHTYFLFAFPCYIAKKKYTTSLLGTGTVDAVISGPTHNDVVCDVAMRMFKLP